MINMKRISFGFIIFLVGIAFFWRAPLAFSATIDEIHLSWQNDPRTTMTIMWRTDVNQSAPAAQYGTTVSYGSEATGATQPAVLDGYYYHTVELTGLSANTTYHYRVSGVIGAWSDDNTFRTAPNGPADFSFTAFADNGIEANEGIQAKIIKEKIAAENTAFVLVPGDLTRADGDACSGQPCQKQHWEDWFREMEPLARSSPVLPAFGNHESKSDVKFSSGETFYERSFALSRASGSEYYYSFDYGDVHFIALDSENYRTLRRGQAQYEWLTRDLAATSEKFIIVYFHHTAYSSGNHDPIQTIQSDIVPLFDQYNVDLVISGHNHHYERTAPINGTIYVVNGGGGAGLQDFRDPKPDWSQVRYKGYEYVRVDVDDAGIITITAKDLNGGVIDRFTISRGLASEPSEARSLATEPATITPITSTQTIRGFNFAVWWHDVLSKTSTQESIRNMKTAGANYFGLAPFWYQDNKNSVAIYRHPEKSATDESTRSAIRYAKSQGLKVALKPMVDSRDNTWRGQLVPSNTDAWFQSYKDFILNYARLCQDEGVEWLVIGTEFVTMTRPQYSAKWSEIIREVRAVYGGKITYAANWGKRADGEYYQVDWWDGLDAIGIDGYFPLATTNTPSVANIVSAWTSIDNGGNQNWFNDIKTLHERYNKPVIFTEIGYLSCDGTGKKPWAYPCGASADLQEQADLYNGTMQFWKDKDWMLGFLWWRWDADPNKGGANDGDFVPQNKQPALNMLAKFWVDNPPAVQSSTTNYPITQLPNYQIFVYGKPRLPHLSQERVLAGELAAKLKIYFNGSIPLNKKFWPIYINAYIYGDYPMEAIARAIRVGGKTVHTSIPWTAWRKSSDYQKYMR